MWGPRGFPGPRAACQAGRWARDPRQGHGDPGRGTGPWAPGMAGAVLGALQQTTCRWRDLRGRETSVIHPRGQERRVGGGTCLVKACRHEWGTRGRAHGANGDGGAAGAAAPCCRPRGGASASAGSPRLAASLPLKDGRPRPVPPRTGRGLLAPGRAWEHTSPAACHPSAGTRSAEHAGPAGRRGCRGVCEARGS